MIVVSEVVHTGEVHLEFNTCFVQIVSQMYPGQLILFRGEEQHARAVDRQLADPNICYESFPAYYDRKGYSWPRRILGEMKAIYGSLKQGRKQKARRMVWTCLFPTGHLFLVMYSRLFLKKQKQLIVLHGELELLKSKGKRRTERFLGNILRYAMNHSGSNIQYIVLGESIRENLRAYIRPAVHAKVVSMLHPYDYSQSAESPSRSYQTPIRLGAIGTQMLSKNSQQLFELATAFQSDIEAGKVSFESIGQVLPELEPHANQLVKARFANDFVPQQLFEAAVEELDFVLFFYDNQSYALCASGAVFEAIRRGVPIISIENDYFRWLFDCYGNMGFLCRDLNEMKQLITEIKNGRHRSEIDASLVTIAAFRRENDLKTLANDLSVKL
jgi:hypothetical protein